MIKQVFLILIFICSSFLSFAQKVHVQASLDSTNILLGDQIKLHLTVEKTADAVIEFPNIKDTISHDVEIIRALKKDTLKKGDNQILTQSYIITAFDSGPHTIPSVYFKIKKGQRVDSMGTAPLVLNVVHPNIDLKKDRPYAIIDPKKAPINLKEALPWLLGVICILCIIFFVVYGIHRYRYRKSQIVPPTPIEPAHVIALREIAYMKENKVWLKMETKEYYSKISDVFREYLDRRYGIIAMESTSDEILEQIRIKKILEEKQDSMKALFGLCDLVKFAKWTPSTTEYIDSLDYIEAFVLETKKEIIETENDEENGSKSN